MKKDPLDPKGLIREAYRMDGIGIEECRSIFLDFALSHPDGVEIRETLRSLLSQYADQPKEHPMTQVLTAGLETAAKPKRRGGWRARHE